MNSLGRSWAVRAERTGVRIACANQFYAGMKSLVTLREVYYSSETDLLAMPRKTIHAILSRFKDALRVYETAMGEEIFAEGPTPALVAAGLPRVHASVIGARAERDASHNALLTKWSTYQVATAYLTREVLVNPERERFFERAAASALLASVTWATGENDKI